VPDSLVGFELSLTLSEPRIFEVQLDRLSPFDSNETAWSSGHSDRSPTLETLLQDHIPVAPRTKGRATSTSRVRKLTEKRTASTQDRCRHRAVTSFPDGESPRTFTCSFAPYGCLEERMEASCYLQAPPTRLLPGTMWADAISRRNPRHPSLQSLNLVLLRQGSRMTLIAKIFLRSTSGACMRPGCSLISGKPLLMSRMVPLSQVLSTFGDDAGMVVAATYEESFLVLWGGFRWGW
jgi:hypothetical protein